MRRCSLQHQTSNERSLTRAWFGLFPFRSPLLRESRLISFPPVTEMFHFAGFADCAYFLSFSTTCHGFTMVGTPIRTSPDQSLLSGSPRLIAASHVLLRFQLPRYPPSALTTLVRHTRYSLVKDQQKWLHLCNQPIILLLRMQTVKISRLKKTKRQ